MLHAVTDLARADRRADLRRLLLRNGGAATWAELSTAVSQHALRSALARGDVVRSARGRYVLADLTDPLSAAARAGGALSGLSAARYLGAECLSAPTLVDVSVPRGSNPRAQPGVRLHRTHLDARELDEQVTSPLRTALDCAAWLPLREALPVVDSLLRRGLVGRSDLVEAASAMQGPGRARRLRVVQAGEGDAANPLESAVRAILLEAGITGLVVQCPVPMGTWVAHADLGDPVRKVAVEADGFTYHSSRSALARDCRRYSEMTTRGWLVLRFAWDHVMFDAPWVAATVAAACRLRDTAARNGSVS